MAEASVYDDSANFADGESATIYGTSDQFIDPYCEPCFEDSRTKIDAICFCQDCNVFLCPSCDEFHKKLPILHRALRGSRMPKSYADKPIKYPACGIHAGNTNEFYCLDHHKMVCGACMEQDHQSCRVMAIYDVCQDLGSDDIKRFMDVVYGIKHTITNTKSELEQNASDLKDEKESMIAKAEEMRDKIISKADEMFEETVSNITEHCQKKCSQIAEQILTLTDGINAVDEVIKNIKRKISANFDQNMFIRMQQIVSNTRECKKEIDNMTSQLHKTELLFVSSKELSTFLDCSKTLAEIKEVRTQLGSTQDVKDIIFPHLSSMMRKIKPDTTSRDIAKITVKKMTPLNIKRPDDKTSSDELYLAVTVNGILLVSDRLNESLKVISQDSKLLSSVRLSDNCYGVTVTKTATAVVSTGDKKLHFVDISDPSSASVQRSISLGYWVVGVAAYDDNLVVTRFEEPVGVKLIDMNGRELWSVEKDPGNHMLFDKPYGVVINKTKDGDTVVVSDWGKESLTLLDASDGTLLKIIDVKGKFPLGLTVDNNGNIFLCCKKTQEICIWSNDFSESRALIAQSDIREKPDIVVYNWSTDELFVAYIHNCYIDKFQVTVAANK